MDLTSFSDIISNKLTDWSERLIELLPNFALAVVILILFVFAARLLRRLTYNLLSKFSQHVAVNKLISTLIAITVVGVGVFVALDIVKLHSTVTSLLAGAGLAGLAISLAFQDLATNFVSGVMLAVRKPIEVGELVDTNNYYGRVTNINLRATELLTLDGRHVVIPNKQVFQSPIENFSRNGRRRIDLPVGISYGDDPEKVKRVTLEAVAKVRGVENDTTMLHFDGFGNSSINFTVYFWIKFSEETDYLGARGEAVMRIKEAYNENDITIPFPIRTLDFGIKGGERLAEVLAERPLG